jgi:hypothetical protein
MRNFALEVLTNPLSARAGIAQDVDALMVEIGKLTKASEDAVAEMFADPVQAVMFILGLPDMLTEAVAKKAYKIGRSGGADVAESIQHPLAEDVVKEEPKPGWLASPAARLEYELSALKHWFLGTRLARIGNRIGYAVGWVAIQVLLVAFTS